MLLRALWDSIRPSRERVPESIRALDDIPWSRASLRAFGTRWCTTRMAPALLARTGLDLSAESASIVAPMLARLLAGGGHSIPIDGGPSRLVEVLAEPLRLRLGCRVEDLETTSEGVRVRYRSPSGRRIALADAAVVALPPSEILRVCSKLAPIERGHFESIQPRRSIVIHRQVTQEAWLLRGLAGVTFVPGELPDLRDLRILGPPSEPYASDPFWLRISLEVEAVDAYWDATDQQIIYRVDSAFRGSSLGALPPGPSRVERIEEILSVQGRGALARRDRFEQRSERSPRLVFATEALATPDLEGRVTVGMRAARELAEGFDRPPVPPRLQDRFQIGSRDRLPDRFRERARPAGAHR